MKHPFARGPLLTLLITTLLLSACGFQLRGTLPVSPALTRLAITGDNLAYNRLLAKTLGSSGIQITDSAPYRIRVLAVTRNSRQPTRSSASLDEKLLQLSVRYRLETDDNLALFEPVELSTERYIAQNKNLGNAAQSEIRLVFQELTEELTVRTLKQIARVSEAQLSNELVRARVRQEQEQSTVTQDAQ